MRDLRLVGRDDGDLGFRDSERNLDPHVIVSERNATRHVLPRITYELADPFGNDLCFVLVVSRSLSHFTLLYRGILSITLEAFVHLGTGRVEKDQGRTEGILRVFTGGIDDARKLDQASLGDRFVVDQL